MAESKDTRRPFTRRKQFLQQLWILSWRWLLNVILCVSCGVVLWHYCRKNKHQPLTDKRKRLFNALFTGLVLGIGLNLQKALNHLAGAMKWRFLSAKRRKPTEFNYLLATEEQTSVLKLMWHSPVSWGSVLCGLWLLFNLAAQIVLASLSLTYTMALPVDFGSTTTRAELGRGSVAALDRITSFYLPALDSVVKGTDRQAATANIFGLAASADPTEDFQAFVDGPSINTLYHVNGTDGQKTWFKYFGTERADGRLSHVDAGQLVSNRSITAFSSCVKFNITSHNYDNGHTQVTFDVGGSKTREVTFPQNARGQVTYTSEHFDKDLHQESSRSVYVYAFASFVYHNNSESIALFGCNSTVDHVFENGRKAPIQIQSPPQLVMPNEQAQIIAGAIGWPYVAINLFPYGSPWAFYPDVHASVAGDHISKFAIGIINTMDQYGPRHNVTGVLVMTADVELQVEWLYALLILVGLPLGHLLLIFLALWLTSATIVHDNNPFGMALLLREALHPLKHGKMLSSNEVADHLHEDLMFGWQWGDEDKVEKRKLQDEDEELEHGESDETDSKHDGIRFLTILPQEQQKSKQAFPKGLYD